MVTGFTNRYPPNEPYVVSFWGLSPARGRGTIRASSQPGQIRRCGFPLASHSGLLELLGKGILAHPANRAFAPIAFRLGSRPDCFLMDRFPGRHATDQLFDLREPLLLQDAGRDRGPISSRAMYGERPIFG